MQNKWYVVGMVTPAVVLGAVTLWCAVTQNWLLGALPAGLTALLFRGAWWAGHCEAFASTDRRDVGDVGTSVALARWQQHCADRDATAKAATPTAPPPTK